MYLKRSDLIGALDNQEIYLSDDTLELGEGVAKIFPDDGGGYRIVSYVENAILINGEPLIGQRKLEHNQIIRLPEETYVFKDDESAIAWQDKIKEVLKVEELEKKYKPQMVATLKAKHFGVFWQRGKHAGGLLSLAGRLTFFARRKYGFERTIFYLVEGNGVVPLIAVCPEDTYHTPERLLRKTWETKAPVIFSLKKAGFSSLSIMENAVEYAFCSPLYGHKTRSIQALFYSDSTKKIHDFANIGLAHICSEIGWIIEEIREGTEKDEGEEKVDLKEIEDKGEEDPPPGLREITI